MTATLRAVQADITSLQIDAVVNGLAIKRLGSFEDCVNVCDFYISRTSSNITGQVIYLGGIT